MKVTPIRHNRGRWPFQALAALAMTTVTAIAHPGHDHAVTPPQHPMHWLVEPQHLIGWIGAGCLAVVAVKIFKAWTGATAARQMRPQPIQRKP